MTGGCAFSGFAHSAIGCRAKGHNNLTEAAAVRLQLKIRLRVLDKLTAASVVYHDSRSLQQDPASSSTVPEYRSSSPLPSS